ncbi:MAG: bifunctional pyr operon transcriptional regulator/uracil phosphoribosyltransferase PyrR [Chloroflexi bacterium]|nr:bifunctional pyr operon transcriptional regulator/uracil phosphoribosyltransferase PyrR [Chloroflexota bacterium]
MPEPLGTPGTRTSGGGTLLDADGVRRTIRRLAHEIVEGNGGVEGLALVGIPTRGTTLAVRLADAIEAFEGERPPVGTLDVTLHRDDLARRGLRSTLSPSALPDIEGRHVVLVDDVLYTGRTVRAALDALIDYGRPQVVRLVVLVDRGHRELPIRADSVGKNIPTAEGDQVQVLLEEEDGRDAVIVIPGGEQR